MEHKDLVPMKWPDGWGRTLLEHRKTRSQWKKPFLFYREQVIKELEKLGASAVTISRQEPSIMGRGNVYVQKYGHYR